MVKRLEYLDAMRGFTMTLVVIGHVFAYCMKHENIINAELTNLRLPLFFFVSGFLVYKNDLVWNARNMYSFLQKKFRQQIIPTIVFVLLFSYVIGFLELKENGIVYHATAMGCYWFTYTLFLFFCVYACVKYLSYALRINEIGFILLLLLSLVVFVGSQYGVQTMIDIPQCVRICFGGHKQYFLFFLFGSVFRRFSPSICALADNGKWMGLVIVLFWMVLLFPTGSLCITITRNLLVGVLGIFIVFMFFRSKQSRVSKETRIGSYLQYVGTRTLDIYLLHYFFLPLIDLSMISTNLFRTNPLLDFCFALVIAIIIIGCCLLVSNIIRLSDLLSFLLFGVKKR